MPLEDQPTKKRRKEAKSKPKPSGSHGDGDGDGDDGGSNCTDAEEGACQHCFLKPCITETAATAPFLGNGNPPSAANTGIRKKLYKRFWHMIDNLGGWRKNEYLFIKTVTHNKPAHHQRELMPKCVLTKVRSLYPKTESEEYMNHRWL